MHREQLYISMTWRDDIEAVRVSGPDDVRRAAEALHQLSLKIGDMRAAPSHNIADKRTPVDVDGAILARDVFG